MEENLRKSLRLFMYCGLSTLFWGVMFGGYFGDAVDIVSRTYFGHTVTIPALWFVPLNDPMKLLVYSMLFGVISPISGAGTERIYALKGWQGCGFYLRRGTLVPPASGADPDAASDGTVWFHRADEYRIPAGA